MTIPLDLNLLESPEKFQQLCFRLTRRAYPDAIPVAIGSWDGGRDIVCLKGPDGDVVWQCKFTRRSLAQLKPRVRESLDALNPKRPIQKWIPARTRADERAIGGGHSHVREPFANVR